MTMAVITLITLLIALIVTVVQLALSPALSPTDPQLTSLESGFENVKYVSTLSSSFFMLAVLFVLFDLELVLVFPIILFSHYLVSIKLLFISFLIMFILLTLLMEWALYGLKWSS